jgi:Rrf2 family iron-sulfur cluster assembly transcriptional regulator
MFAVSTRTRYGLRALYYLSINKKEKPITLHHISDELHISFKYLENIFKLLTRSGIVRGERGPAGGYNLVKAPEDLTLYEIADALDGPLVTVACVSDSKICDRIAQCPTREVWDELQTHIYKFLKAKKLAGLFPGTEKEKKV